MRHVSIVPDNWPYKNDLSTVPGLSMPIPYWDLSDFGEYVQCELPPFVRRHVYTCYFLRVSPKSVVCVLVFANGFDVRGESACVNPTHFDPAIGAKYALHTAVAKASAIIAYQEQEKLFRGENPTYYDTPAPKE